MKRTLLSIFAFVLFVGSFCFAFHNQTNATAETDSLIIYPEYDARIPKCYDYGVTVHQGSQSQKLQVYNRNSNGEQMSNRCFQPDFNRRFCEFAFTGKVRVDIEVYRDFTSYSILPSAKEYRNEYHDGIISVWLEENSTNFMLRLDDEDATILSIFADAPETYKYQPNDPSVLYVNQKWFDPNGSELIYNVPEHIKTIYIAPGCVLYSRLLIKTDDVTVCGHGMLVDPYSNYYDTQSIGLDNYKMVVRVEGSNITLKDFKMIDSQNWNIYLYSGYDHTISNVKILTARITTDAVAVGSGNVTIENCVFYVSDNVFTYNGDRGFHHIRNCLIGTTCAAFFPQHHSSYDIDFTDIYVFRANEGIVNNWYNPARIQSDIKHITFTNLDCVDMVHTPWIFSAYDLGDAEKYFTFQNCHFANIRGDSNIESWDKTAGQAVYVENNEKYMHCSGYKIEFFNCTLDQKPLTDAAMLHPQLTDGDEITFIMKNDLTGDTNRTTSKVVHHVYDKKVMIGNDLQSLKYQPIKNNGTVYLPERELCNALGVNVNQNTTGITNGSVKYISLATVQQYYTKAAYKEDTKAIKLTAVPDVRFNLVKDDIYTSRWNPYAYPNVILGPYVDKNDEIVLRCDVNSNTNYPGMFADITSGLRKNGADVYTISFDAKSTDDNSYNGEIWLHNIQYNGYQEIDRKVTKPFTVTKDWNTVKVEVDLSEWDISEHSLEFIRICSANTPGYDVLFKNVKMVKTNATKDAVEVAIDEEDTDNTPGSGSGSTSGGTNTSGDDNANTSSNNANKTDIAKCAIQFARKTYYYTGKAQQPKLIVQSGTTTLVKDTDYTVAYHNNKKVGTGTAVITGTGNYTGSMSASFAINPAKPVIKKITSKNKRILVQWKAKKKQGASYKIQYSKKKNFKNKKTLILKSSKKTKAVIKKLKSGKKYYVRICAYKKVKGKTYRSPWVKRQVKVK